MLSRSGLSIRKLIPHRRLSDEDLSGLESRKEEIAPVFWTDRDSTSRYSHRKKRAPAPIIATGPLTHSDIRPLPPLPTETPRSSASSSCRCERHSECDCPLLRRSPRYSVSPKEEGASATLLSCVNSESPDDTLTSHIPKSRFSPPDGPRSEDGMARALSPEERHSEERPTDRRSEEATPQRLLDDIQQFMQETEDAFKAIGSTLSSVPVHSISTPNTTKPASLELPRHQEPAPPTPPPKESPIPPSKSPSAKTSPAPGPSPANNTPKSNLSVQKPKRKKSKKSKKIRSMRSTRKPTAPKQVAKSGPRWTLSENVSELLSGKLFHRIEADEMLTPDQIEAFKQQRITKLQVDKMVQALEHELVDTPVESFHLDDFPSRAGSLDSLTSAEALREEQPTVTFPDDLIRRDFTPERQHHKETIPSSSGQRPAAHKSNTVPVASSRHVRSASRKAMTELPIIPESNTTPRTSDGFQLSNDSHESLGHSSTSEYVYLRSPAYSLAAPAFRHGPIRLAKSNVMQEMKLVGEDGLDWTAFQMAILGGAGDLLFPDGDDMPDGEEAREAAGIAEWWNSWNFESAGGLVTRDYEAPSPTSTLSGDEIPDLAYGETESSNLYSPRHTWQETPRNTPVSGLRLNLDYAEAKKLAPSRYFTDSQGNVNEMWRQDSEQKEVVVNRESVNSLPPSPMLDLRVIRSANGDDLDVVPMGYNLGHDLGDFLKWEAEHAYAGDFSSPILM